MLCSNNLDKVCICFIINNNSPYRNIELLCSNNLDKVCICFIINNKRKCLSFAFLILHPDLQIHRMCEHFSLVSSQIHVSFHFHIKIHSHQLWKLPSNLSVFILNYLHSILASEIMAVKKQDVTS